MTMNAESPTHRIAGCQIRTVISGRQTAGSFALLDTLLDPGALASPPHTHSREDEWSYVLEGELTVDFSGRTVVAGPGDVVFKPRGEAHSFLNRGDTPVHFLALFAPTTIEPYFGELAPLVPEHAPPDVAGIMALAARYGIQMHLDHLPRMARQYGLSLPGLSQEERL
jgi:quercetin dioxygenase-like cupin family protein